MTNLEKRYLLFLLGCIPVRLFIAYSAKNADPNRLQLYGYVGLLVGLGFLYLWITNSRQTGPEVFGEKIWWTNLRIVHAVLILLFSYFAINKNKNAYVYLGIDAILGLLFFINHHFIN